MNNLSINFVSKKSERKNKLVFIFWNDYLCRSKKYSNDFDYANELMHMTSMISNSMLYHNYDRIMCHDIEEALTIAKASGFVHAVVQTPGNIIQKHFADIVYDYIKDKDYFIAGHILDGRPKGQYLWMHEQCFVMNLSHLDNFNYTIDWTYGKTKTLQDYERSEDNFHDDYTPLWIKRAANKIEVTQYDWTADWLSYGLEKDALLVFNDKVRGSKFHMYPENNNHRETWLGLCNEDNQLNRIIENACKIDTQQHVFNNENFSRSAALAVKDKIDTLVVPASGFFAVHAAKNFSPRKIIFYDIDQKTLNFRKAINEQWDPSRSLEVVEVDGLNPFTDKEIPKIPLLDHDWFKSDLEIDYFWKQYQRIEKEYVCIDIIKDYDSFSRVVPNNGNVYIWLNSIYTYSVNIWNHRPKKIFESYFGLLTSLAQNRNKIWIDCKEPTGQYRTFEVHSYLPDAAMFANANYRKYM